MPKGKRDFHAPRRTAGCRLAAVVALSRIYGTFAAQRRRKATRPAPTPPPPPPPPPECNHVWGDTVASTRGPPTARCTKCDASRVGDYIWTPMPQDLACAYGGHDFERITEGHETFSRCRGCQTERPLC